MPAPTDTGDFSRRAYALLTSDDEGRLCRDIPDAACAEQPGNFVRHVLSLAASKTADGLADTKLVLAWLLGALGAPGWMLGLIVPIREAGSLLPQLAIAAAIRARPRRKFVWALGATLQGAALLGMAAAATWLAPEDAAIAILGLLALGALARGACSVSYKDVLGKTIAKSTRGTATGTAGSTAALLVLGFGVALASGVIPRQTGPICAVLAAAGLLMIAASALFLSLEEVAGATEGGASSLRRVREQWQQLRSDRQLQRFIATRALLTATALSPPFLLAATADRGASATGTLGPFVMASALATILSAYVWGRLADRSSRQVLIRAAGIGALALGTGGALALTGDALSDPLLSSCLLFVLVVAHQGVRLGRSTHVTDMADSERRANYTALSNSAIGLVLVAGSGFGMLADAFGHGVLLLVFGAMCVAGIGLARGLEEVQNPARDMPRQPA
ncbi:MAG: MFS transporter [Rhodocyclaceae bacterium]|nr:MFS transporter [Rhodocyclaceae bacterium]